MANERLTEEIVRDHFKGDALFKSIKFEEQKSSSKVIANLLKGKSKTGGKGVGAPEFIISFPTDSRYIIIIECKAEPAKHESKNRNKTKTCAVDGVLHYAQALSVNYDIIAIAVSGETIDQLMVSHFLWKKGTETYEELIEDKQLLPINSYLHLFANEQFADNLRNIDIVSKAIELNEDYNNYSIPEQTRNTTVSAVLLSLLHAPFRESYKSEPTTNSLKASMMQAIRTTLELGSVRNGDAMLREFSKLLNEPLFREKKIKNKKNKKVRETLEVLKEMITYLHQNVYPLVNMEHSGFDVLGRFYTEFIRYAGSEQKQGLVLTPFHITDLFCDLANLTEHDILYDPCCGTAGFLIAGMKQMFQKAGNNEDLKLNIRTNQLIGVELRPSMYTYACSNMMLRGDGRSNIYCGNCYQLKNEIIGHKPTVSFLNPPYDVGSAEQLRFVGHALDIVAPQNGRVVAIVQMSCAIKDEKDLKAVKKQLLAKHHLKAVLSMPDDLFYPVGVVTCVMVWETNKPNKGLKTWFGYFKDDGFEKRKHQGRIDARGRYKEIRKQWIDAYNNLSEIDGLAIRHEVNSENEWCAEAYMQTNYSNLSMNDFVKTVMTYTGYIVSSRKELVDIARIVCKNLMTKPNTKKQLPQLGISDWKWFSYNEIFTIKKGKRLTKADMIDGSYNYIGATDSNNGITASIGNTDHIHSGNKISVSYNGSIAEAFYQADPFWATDDVNVISLKGHKLNVYLAMFLITLIKREKYRFNYGRKWDKELMLTSQIKLPVTDKGIPNWQFMENYIKGLPYNAKHSHRTNTVQTKIKTAL